MWKSKRAHDDYNNNIRFYHGNHQMVGLDRIEIDIPNSTGSKVYLDLLTFKAKF